MFYLYFSFVSVTILVIINCIINKRKFDYMDFIIIGFSPVIFIFYIVLFFKKKKTTEIIKRFISF